MNENSLRNLLIIHLRKQGITEIEIEVQNPYGNHSADLVFIDMEGKINTVELKKYFNDKLWWQLSTWKFFTYRVWAAVMSRVKKDISNYFDRGYGILILNGDGFECLAEPKIFKIKNHYTDGGMEEELIKKFRVVQQQKEEVIKQKCYHAFTCRCWKKVHGGQTQFVRFYRDNLKMLRIERFCSDCGGKL